MKGSISAAAALSPPTRPSHTHTQPQPCSDAAETIAYRLDYKLEIGAAGFLPLHTEFIGCCSNVNVEFIQY